MKSGGSHRAGLTSKKIHEVVLVVLLQANDSGIKFLSNVSHAQFQSSSPARFSPGTLCQKLDQDCCADAQANWTLREAVQV